MSWTLIESQTLGASAASVTLGSGGTIPQTYKTLKLVVSARGDNAGNYVDVVVRPNAATTNLTSRYLTGNGSATASGTYADALGVQASASGSTASTFGSGTVEIPNYSGNTNKPISIDSVSENNATAAAQVLSAVLWSSTAAITSIRIDCAVNNFVSGSSFTLYGLK